ncbi:MAG: transcription antitermination factor NusB [Bacteroidota bacterium]
MINRRLVRETVLQALYAHLKSGDTAQHTADTIIKTILDSEKEARRFAEQLFFNTLSNEDELSQLISTHIQNWELNRLAIIDLLVLKQSIAEFLYFEDIPTKVTINEAIEIAKKFSTAKSGRFVNGILDAVLNDLKEEGRIKKTGRGLVEQTLRG